MKRVLIITYYWPPCGGIGVLRCLKFVKYLRDFGWEPVVYAPENAQYPYLDETNFKDIPDNITILKFPIREPFNIFKKVSGRDRDDPGNPVYARDKKVKFIDNLAICIRGNFFIPDARSLWIKPSLKYLSEYLKENPVDAILTDGPPHTNTMIGCRIAEKFNIPWLADFQDPWTQVDYYKMLKIGKRADRKHRRMEQEVFRVAKKITIASPTWGKELEEIGAKNVDVLYYGYDKDDFSNIIQELDEEFTIFHAGLLGYDRKPDTLFKVLKDIKKEIKGFNKDLKLKFAGLVDYSVNDSIIQHNLEENYENLGIINRNQALEQTCNSQILLLPLNKAENVMGRIPGKLFEYLRSRRPVLCLGPKGSDVEGIINKTNSGNCYEYEDYHGIKEYITKRYFEFKETVINNTEGNIEEYYVRNLTGKVASYLNEITKV